MTSLTYEIEEFRLFSEGAIDGGLIDLTAEISFDRSREWHVTGIRFPAYDKRTVRPSPKDIHLDRNHPLYALICNRLESDDYAGNILDEIEKELSYVDPDYLYERKRDDALWVA